MSKPIHELIELSSALSNQIKSGRIQTSELVHTATDFTSRLVARRRVDGITKETILGPVQTDNTCKHWAAVDTC
jgi:hypothetical protein